MRINNLKYVDALSFLSESGEYLANGPSNEAAIQLVTDLMEFGCTVLAELDVDYNEEERFDACLFVRLPKEIRPELIVTIVGSRPDEISEEEDGVLRLWWD